MCLNNHGEVGVVCLWHILLVFAQLDRHNVSKVRTRVIPEKEENEYLAHIKLKAEKLKKLAENLKSSYC